MTTPTQITERALLARINRRLAREGKRISKIRPATPYAQYRFTCSDERNNICNPSGDDLEAIGRELRVLREGEVLQ